MIKDPTTEHGKRKTIFINRTLNLPVSTVWKAWSEPEYMKKWYGPENYTCPSSTIDFTVGGKYLHSMMGPDGKEIWSTGTYKEIIPKKKIVLTDSFADSNGNIVSAFYYSMPGDWALELLITVEFEDIEGKTYMKMQHAGLPAEVTEDCVKGWQSCFDKMERYLK